VAANTGNKSDLKRDEVKYVRDRAKARYPKGNCCAICDTTENLEFHHYSSLTLLWEKWKVTSGISIDNVEDVMFHRDTVYGSKPALFTAKKQANWVKIQHDKLHKD
jgi:hypothetical protein